MKPMKRKNKKAEYIRPNLVADIAEGQDQPVGYDEPGARSVISADVQRDLDRVSKQLGCSQDVALAIAVKDKLHSLNCTHNHAIQEVSRH